ncbi:hypothetical protein G9A89_000908, partial [Geosiphon pyriformis]
PIIQDMFHDAEASPLFAKGPDQRPVITFLYHLNHRSRLVTFGHVWSRLSIITRSPTM